MLNFNKQYSGNAINVAVINNNGIINVDGTKVRINKKLDAYGVYTFRNNNGKVVLEKDSKSWTCSKENYDMIMKDGKDIVNRMFGDVLDKTYRK